MSQYRSSDKTFGGIPGLLFRTRLEYGISTRPLKGKRDLLVSMHSQEMALNPTEKEKPSECEETLAELIAINDRELKTLIYVNKYGEDVPVSEEEENRATLLLEACLFRIDQVMERGHLIENIRPAQGPPLP